MILICCLLFSACGQAGTVLDNAAETTNPSTSSTNHISGMVGIGEPLTNATITITNVTDESNPEVITTTTSANDGSFEADLGEVQSNSKILFVASGGAYVDPLTFQSVSNQNSSLAGVWKYSHLATLSHVDITPLSTLAKSFYICLSSNEALATDPLDYSLATFKSLFEINLNSVTDTYLETSATDTASLYSLYNLAFARMAKEKRATSALNIITAYSQHIEENCDLLGPTSQTSGYYAFHQESFRRDYLNALENMRLEAAFSSWVDSLDVEQIVDSIRSESNILFQFEDYSL